MRGVVNENGEECVGGKSPLRYITGLTASKNGVKSHRGRDDDARRVGPLESELSHCRLEGSMAIRMWSMKAGTRQDKSADRDSSDRGLGGVRR